MPGITVKHGGLALGMRMHKTFNSYANRGMALEELIERLTANLPDCVLFRQNNKWVPLKSGKGGAFPAKGAPVDFVGAIRGIPVALECKEVKKGRKFPLTASRLPEKEIDALSRFERVGRTFLLVAYWSEDVLAVYSGRYVLEEIILGKQYLEMEEGRCITLGSGGSSLSVKSLMDALTGG